MGCGDVLQWGGKSECPVGFIISSFAVSRILNNRMCLLIIQVIDDLIHQLFLLLHQ